MATWVERTARQRSLWQVMLFLLVTVIVISLFALNASYWGPFFHGPTAVEASGLDAAAAAAENYTAIPTPFATVTGEQVVDTGTQEVTTYDFIISRVSAGYYALKVGDKVLIVKNPKPPATTVAGSLGPMPLDLKTQLFPSDADPKTVAQVYPLLLDTNYRESGAMAIFWALLAEVIFGFFAWRSLMRLTGRQDHPAVARAKAWGDLAVTSVALEAELQSAVKCKSKGWTLTENFVVQRTLFRFNLFRMENLLWAYKNATKRSVNFIPAGTSYSATMNFSDGVAVVEGKQKQVDEMLELAHVRASWALIGYNDELAALYKKSSDEFAAEVLRQKAAMRR
jgi:hypothetical protein